MQKIYNQSERIKLCDFKDAYLEHFYTYRNDSELMRYQDFHLNSRQELDDFFKVQKTLELGQNDEWKQIAIASHDDILIGDCAFKLCSHESRLAELGISLGRAYHGKGYAYEALQLLISYVFENLNIHKLIAVVDCRNTASIKLFENLNFDREGVFRSHYWDKKDRAWYDEWYYGLLKEEHAR